VLLRHRLLLQPEGGEFECTLLGPALTVLDTLSFSEAHEPYLLHGNGNAASHADGCDSGNDRDVLTEIDVLECLDCALVERFARTCRCFCECLTTTERLRLGLTICRKARDVRVEKIEDRGEVTGVGERDPLPGEIDVLLRNTRSPGPFHSSWVTTNRSS
jgi:hypothetical protein